MKKMWLMIGLAALVITFAGLAMSNDASIKKGKELFNDTGLGGSPNADSCGTYACHPDGRGLAQDWDDANLTSMINICIERPLKGQALDIASAEMESLRLYIKSLKK